MSSKMEKAMVAKTVYDVTWKPSIATAIVLAAAVASNMYVPYFYQQPVYVNPVFGFTVQLGFCIGASMFMFAGVQRSQLIRIISTEITAFALLGILSNLFHQATFLISTRILASDTIVLALLNAGAIAITLSLYRIESRKIEVSPEDLDKPTADENTLKLLTPVVLLAPVLISSFALSNARYVPNSQLFKIAIPFFIVAQITISLIAAFNLFKTQTTGEKLRLSFAILALSMFYGTIANLTSHITALTTSRERLQIDSNEFILWNAGAIITVLVFVHWRKFLNDEKQKRHRLAATASSTESDNGTATTGSIKTENTSAAGSTPAEISTSTENTGTTGSPTENVGAQKNATTENSSTPGTKSEADSAKQTVGEKGFDSSNSAVVETSGKEKV